MRCRNMHATPQQQVDSNWASSFLETHEIKEAEWRKGRTLYRNMAGGSDIPAYRDARLTLPNTLLASQRHPVHASGDGESETTSHYAKSVLQDRRRQESRERLEMEIKISGKKSMYVAACVEVSV